MNEMPVYLFITLLLLAFVLLFYQRGYTNLQKIMSTLLSGILMFVLSKVSINGQLSRNYVFIDSTDSVVTETITYTNSAQAYILQFVGLICVLILIVLIIEYIRNEMIPNEIQ